MTEITDTCLPDAPEAASPIRAEAVATLHLLALRRQFDVIRLIFGDDVPHHSREFLWVALEVVLAELAGERIALRDLVIRAEGVLSAPTLSRVVAELEARGFLLAEPAPNSRLKLLRPTARTMQILAMRAGAAFEEFARTIRLTEQRLAELRQRDDTRPAE